MSFQKKSLILQQLEQAIKKKAQQKSRNKDAMSRVIQGSIQKKKNILKTATNKDNRIASIHKNSETASKQNLPDKPVSIFNNEHLTAFESTQFKAKKYNNRRLDKLVSLIQYMISSSQKALRYISSTNFQAEFALKLYRSDRENLANELKNLNFDDIMESQRYGDHKGAKQDQTFNILLEENNQLKKEILILEKQAESYHNKLKIGQSTELKHLEKYNNKLKEMLRKIIPFDNFKHILQILEKENKFQVMALKCQENSKKTTQIQIVISSLENERANIIDNLTKLKERNDKHYKLGQIQGEKEQLQKELNQMKVKLSEIIDSGKSLSQLDMVKKNSELVTEKLLSLAKELAPNSQVKRNNEQLIDYIKNASLLLQSKNNQLSQAVGRFVQENQSLKRQLKELSRQNKDMQNQMKSEEQDIRMTNMLSQIQKLRDVVDQLDQKQQRSAQNIQQLEEQLKNKEQEITKLNADLAKETAKGQDMQQIMKQVKDEIQSLTHRLEDKEKYYRDKLAKMEQINKQLSNQISEINEENQQLKSNIEELIRRNDSREDSKLLFSEKAKIDYQDLEQKLEKSQTNFERELKAKTQHIEKLWEQVNQYKMLEAEMKQNQEKNNKNLVNFKKNQAGLIQQLSQLQAELDRMRKEHATVSQKLRITQNEIISNNYSKDQMKFNQAEKENLIKRLQAANSEVSELKDQIKEIQDELQDKDLFISELEMKLDESKALNKKIQMGDIQTTRQLNALKQELEFLVKEKESREKLMQQQRQRHLSEYENLNNKLHQAELLNIQLSKEKVQAKQQLEMQRENNESLKHKMGILQEQITELQDEIRSLTLLSNQTQGERQQSKEYLSNIQQERQSLKKELNSTKQQITQHLELVQYKNKQYVNLLRQILKGLELDPLDYKDLNTFEELLEFGSQQVVQIRKRQREEQSNKRKNNKKEYQGQLSEFYPPNFEDCKAKLFDDSFANKPFEKKELQAQEPEKIDLQQFGELQEKSNNNSMISQENHNHEREGAKLQEFNDLQSQKMNESLISNDLDDKLPDDIGLHSYPKFQEEETNRLKEIEGKQHELERSEVQEQIFTQVQENPASSQLAEEKGENKEEEMVRSKAQPNENLQSEQVKECMVQSYTPQNNSGSLKMDNFSIFFHKENIKVPDKKPKIQPQNRAYSKHTLLSIALKGEKLDLDEFQEVKSVNDNQSYVSSSEIQERQGQLAKENMSQGEIDEHDVQLYPLKLQEKQENQMNLQEFKEVDEGPLSESMLSEKWQHQQVNLQDFGELAQSGLGASMVSVNEQENAEGQTRVPVHLGLEEFGEVEEKMNDSMLSQKKEEHGLSEFGQYGLDKLNESLRSQKEEKEHGMSEFGEIQDDRMSDSIFSENLNNLMQSNNSGGANFDEFDELKSQKMSESMLSQNQASPFAQQADEAESTPQKQLN